MPERPNPTRVIREWERPPVTDAEARWFVVGAALGVLLCMLVFAVVLFVRL